LLEGCSCSGIDFGTEFFYLFDRSFTSEIQTAAITALTLQGRAGHHFPLILQLYILHKLKM
jgi:hypothetical protein